MSKASDVLVIGSGIAGLTTASLLSKDATRVTVLEQNWLPGGCMSSYPRKGYIFESGATTLVGLEKNMPLGYLLDQLGISLQAWELEIPMKVILKDGTELTRYNDLEDWIQEAERVFGPSSQRAFWEYCFNVSKFVWDTSLKQQAFPPSAAVDLWDAAKNFSFKQLGFAGLAFQSMESLLRKYDLLDNDRFVDFVNEQLLITAQNYLPEVNVLFGTTALCYTNYKNYYVPGGMIEVAKLLVDYIQKNGGQVLMRKPVEGITYDNNSYHVTSLYRKQYDHFAARKIVSSIPFNDTLKLFQEKSLRRRLKSKQMDSSQVNSAFSMGIVFKKKRNWDCIHHQIHLEEKLPYIGSHSIFLSLSHPNDTLRCGPNECVASISTHIPDPGRTSIQNKEEIEQAILRVLINSGFFNEEDLIYVHSSAASSWEKWTARSWGFVGGYPQYISIKPWQMIDARLNHDGAYICGDSTYPGQGIPGACLSGIIAYKKMRLDENKGLMSLGLVRKSS